MALTISLCRPTTHSWRKLRLRTLLADYVFGNKLLEDPERNLKNNFKKEPGVRWVKVDWILRRLENVANVSKISVKERSQKFDRMASESALNKVSLPNNANGNSNKKKHDKVSAASFSIGAPLLDYFEAVNMVAK
uniref:Uncharacterized protein n=1 Tax=Rhodnius prolixus TaxID=13249 RepID=T1HLQ7_RHOPR